MALHTTFYVPAPPPERIAAGVTLSQADVEEIRVALASRDGLLRMYQGLLVEKEQRLRDFMSIKRDALSNGPVPDFQVVLSSRSWGAILALHRLKYRLWSLARRLGLARS